MLSREKSGCSFCQSYKSCSVAALFFGLVFVIVSSM